MIKTTKTSHGLQIDICLDGSLPETRLKIQIEPDVPQDRREILLLDWIDLKREEYAMKAKAAGRTPGTATAVKTLRNHLQLFLSARDETSIPLNQVDKDFCICFASYLHQAINLRIGADKGPRPLASNTRKRLFALFETMMNKAVQSGYLENNPIKYMDRTSKPRTVPTALAFLSVEELRALKAHPVGPKNVRDAFLFSCFCGLRWSDIKSLTWDDLKEDSNRLSIAKRTVKTGKWEFTPLNDLARSFLPAKRGSLVFDLPSSTAANADIKRWALAAGIRKKVSFHTARHTFATLLLTLGADLYITSKLLGHSNITTTQIYADVIDEKKIEAVHLMDGVFEMNDIHS